MMRLAAAELLPSEPASWVSWIAGRSVLAVELLRSERACPHYGFSPRVQ